MIADHDMVQGGKVLVGDRNWREGPVLVSICAFLFGTRERFIHLGMLCTVAWWRGKPYLIGLSEARP
jgi:hypothetical protein